MVHSLIHHFQPVKVHVLSSSSVSTREVSAREGSRSLSVAKYVEQTNRTLIVYRSYGTTF